jgi:hypothetical protein
MSIDLNTRMALPNEPWPEYPRGKLFGNWVSTGKDFVQVESPEGQAILNEMIVVRDPELAKAKSAFEAKHLATALVGLALLSMCIGFPAFAQSAPSDKVGLSVTRAELQLIGQGLMELPYKAAAPIMNDLQAQVNAADQAAVKAAADAKAKADADAKPAAVVSPDPTK